MKKALLASILLIPFILIPIAFAGEPGPGVGAGERLVGPTIDAVLGIINNQEGGIDVSVSGICNGQPFSLTVDDYLPSIDLTLVDAGDLVGWRVPAALWPIVAGICNPKSGLEFIITAVNKFNQYSSNPTPYRQIIAEVTIMFVEATPNQK